MTEEQLLKRDEAIRKAQAKVLRESIQNRRK